MYFTELGMSQNYVFHRTRHVTELCVSLVTIADLTFEHQISNVGNYNSNKHTASIFMVKGNERRKITQPEIVG